VLRPSTLGLAGVYFLATVFVRLQASVVDAIHDRSVDAVNPEKSTVAASVDRVGVERAWSLVAAEITVGLVGFGLVARQVGAWPLFVGAAFTLLGFGYSYPPRLKERGVLNHFVTTAVDVGFVVLPLGYLVGGQVTPASLLVGGVVFLFTFGYHVVHQAADTYYDRQCGVRTLATRLGIPRVLVLAAVSTAASAGLAAALGYPLVVLGGAVTTGWYVRLYWRVRTVSERVRTDLLASRFDIARVATALNGVTAVAIWRHTLGRPGLDFLAGLV
jgi:4-hydroxybenzoate polyprenyltransferase and related prenyltransferases